MKRKAVGFIFALLMFAVFLYGCGGGGGHSNPTSSNIAGMARVSGVVYDSSNKPVANAKVRLVLASKALVNSLINNTNSSSARLATTGNQTEFNTDTDNKGQYTFTNVPYGDYTLSAVTANGAQIVTKLAVRAEVVETPEIVLQPFGSISGVVTDGKEPLNGAVVYIDGTSYCSITDDFGGYVLKNVPVNTELSLCAMASGFETKTNSVKIDSTKNINLDSDTEGVDFSLTALTSTTKAYSVKCTVSGEGASLSNLLILAVSDDGKYAYVAPVKSGKAEIYITSAGKYSIIPACIYGGTNIAGTSKSLDITGKQIQSTESKELTLSISKPISGGASAYATLSGSIDNKNTSDTLFEVHLIDETGHDRKQIKTADDLDFTFDNVPDGNYKIIVCSDNTLFVSSNYGLSDGKGLAILSPLTPVVVTPEVTQSNGSATVKIVNSPFVYSNNLASFSVYGFDKSSNPVLLYRNDNGKVDTSVYEFSAKAGMEANVSLDNLNADSTLGGVKFIYRNETDYRSNKPIFEKMYTFDKGKPDYRTFYLGTKGALKLSDNIILFKTVTYDNKLYYLIVNSGESSSNVCVFDSKGELEGSISLSAPVTYGNACFVENSVDPFLIAQYKGGSDLRMEKHLLSNILNSNSERDSSFSEPQKATGGLYQPNSVNKVLATADGKIFSVCDNFVLVYAPPVITSWTQVGFGVKNDTSNRVIVNFSTIVPSSDNNHKIYYINHEDNGSCAGYKAYLGVSKFDDGDNPTTTINKYNYEIGDYHLYYGITSNCDTGATRIGSDEYPYYTLNTDTDYPFSLTDCLDNIEATNKLFIPNGYNWNNGTKSPTINSELVFSNTIYSATNIESSFINAGYNFETWIERKPDEQFFVLRNKNSFKENKILINQVFNSSAYLEGSIGYSTINGEQVHVICADSDNNIQVMVLNCIDPEHNIH